GVAEVLLSELLHERGEEALQGLRRFIHRALVLPVSLELLLHLFEFDAGGTEDEGLFLLAERAPVEVVPRVGFTLALDVRVAEQDDDLGSGLGLGHTGAPHRSGVGGGMNNPENRRFAQPPIVGYVPPAFRWSAPTDGVGYGTVGRSRGGRRGCGAPSAWGGRSVGACG